MLVQDKTLIKLINIKLSQYVYHMFMQKVGQDW